MIFLGRHPFSNITLRQRTGKLLPVHTMFLLWNKALESPNFNVQHHSTKINAVYVKYFLYIFCSGQGSFISSKIDDTSNKHQNSCKFLQKILHVTLNKVACEGCFVQTVNSILVQLSAHLSPENYTALSHRWSSTLASCLALPYVVRYIPLPCMSNFSDFGCPVSSIDVSIVCLVLI
jgi:hypothetical protein